MLVCICNLYLQKKPGIKSKVNRPKFFDDLSFLDTMEPILTKLTCRKNICVLAKLTFSVANSFFYKQELKVQ